MRVLVADDHSLFRDGIVSLLQAAGFTVIGQVGNVLHNTLKLGKAGRKRHAGRRPHGRGICQNAVDHPMGGGRGPGCAEESCL